MKKLLAGLLAALLLLSVSACSVDVKSGEAPAAAEAAEDLTVAAGETLTLDGDRHVGTLTLEEGAVLEADHPVIVFFEESDSVKNGDVMGEVQFVSDYDEVVAILHTNDTHGYLEVVPWVGGLKTALQESGDYSLVLAVDAGDVYSGGYAAAHLYNGEYVPAVMATVYDYMTWGNNDKATDGLVTAYLFAALARAQGLETLVANTIAWQDVDLAAYAAAYQPVIGAADFAALYPDQLSLTADGAVDWSGLDLASYALSVDDDVLPDWAVAETANGSKIGLFGETTSAAMDEEPATTAISAQIASADAAAASVAALQEAGAGVIVGVCHTGWFSPESTETSANDINSAQLAKTVPGIDAIVDGHTHSIIAEGEGWLFPETEARTVVNQANCKAAAIGLMELYLKDGKCIAKNCKNYTEEQYRSLAEPDPQAQAMVDLCYGRLEAEGYTAVVGRSEYFLNAERLSAEDAGGGVRANETNLGDLVADGLLWAAQQVWDEPMTVSLVPGVRVRSSIPAGDITMLDILNVFSAPLVIYYQRLTAPQLVSELNGMLAKVGSENAPFSQVSGLALTYNSSKKVETLSVNGEPVYDGGVYLVPNDWAVGACRCFSGGEVTYGEDDVIFADNAAAAQAFRDYLANGDYTVYPNTVAPAGRILPTADYVDSGAAASGEASGEASGQPS